jgi:hypothetical protein
MLNKMIRMWYNVVRYQNRIHEHTILLRFLCIILRILRLEVSKFNVYKPVQPTLSQGGGGEGLNKPLVKVTVNSKEKTLEICLPITCKNSAFRIR